MTLHLHNKIVPIFTGLPEVVHLILVDQVEVALEANWVTSGVSFRQTALCRALGAHRARTHSTVVSHHEYSLENLPAKLTTVHLSIVGLSSNGILHGQRFKIFSIAMVLWQNHFELFLASCDSIQAICQGVLPAANHHGLGQIAAISSRIAPRNLIILRRYHD